MFSLTPIADSVKRYLLASTTTRPPLLLPAMVAVSHPPAEINSDGEEQCDSLLSPCDTQFNSIIPLASCQIRRALQRPSGRLPNPQTRFEVATHE